jgi:hypothetical protein
MNVVWSDEIMSRSCEKEKGERREQLRGRSYDLVPTASRRAELLPQICTPAFTGQREGAIP